MEFAKTDRKALLTQAATDRAKPADHDLIQPAAGNISRSSRGTGSHLKREPDVRWYAHRPTRLRTDRSSHRTLVHLGEAKPELHGNREVGIAIGLQANDC